MRKYQISTDGHLRIEESDEGVPFDELVEAVDQLNLSELERRRLQKFLQDNKPNLLDIAPQLAEFNNAESVELYGSLGEDNLLTVYRFKGGDCELFMEQSYPVTDENGEERNTFNRTVIRLSPSNAEQLSKFLIGEKHSWHLN